MPKDYGSGLVTRPDGTKISVTFRQCSCGRMVAVSEEDCKKLFGESH